LVPVSLSLNISDLPTAGSVSFFLRLAAEFVAASVRIYKLPAMRGSPLYGASAEKNGVFSAHDDHLSEKVGLREM
jgi:hypothetical protein